MSSHHASLVNHFLLNFFFFQLANLNDPVNGAISNAPTSLTHTHSHPHPHRSHSRHRNSNATGDLNSNGVPNFEVGICLLFNLLCSVQHCSPMIPRVGQALPRLELHARSLPCMPTLSTSHQNQYFLKRTAMHSTVIKIGKTLCTSVMDSVAPPCIISQKKIEEETRKDKKRIKEEEEKQNKNKVQSLIKFD